MEEIEFTLADPVGLEELLEAKALARMIEGFLDTLTRENRVIFMRRYWFAESYEEIGALTGMSRRNVSVRLTRIRSKLRAYLMKEGVYV